VYRDASGATPILRAVSEAERRHAAAQTTKVYVGIAGDADFNRRVVELTLGPARDPARTRAIQTPGGSGALRVLMDLAHVANPNCAIWLSDPTWPNHVQIAGAAGLRVAQYPFVDGTGAMPFEDALAALWTASAGDLALIHGSCHNPTGVDLTLAQ
jgi:aromatic-amino-acid transaminase